MSLTYNAIYETMLHEFEEKSGVQLSEASDVALRFGAVAAQLYSLSTYADYVLKQAFAQTASGECLDMHAQQRGLKRKNANCAKGTLTFGVPQVLDDDVSIPKGTICAVPGNMLLQFETTESAKLPAGCSEVDVPAVALKSGTQYNVQANTVTFLVTPPAYITTVTNKTAFANGFTQESDRLLRERLLGNMAHIDNGINLHSLRERLLAIDEVVDVGIGSYYSTPDGCHELVVRVHDDTVPIMDLQAKITQAVPEFTLLGFNYNLSYARAKPVDLIVWVATHSLHNTAQVHERVRQLVLDEVSELRLGEYIYYSALVSKILQLDGVVSCGFANSGVENNWVSAAFDQYLQVNSVEVV